MQGVMGLLGAEAEMQIAAEGIDGRGDAISGLRQGRGDSNDRHTVRRFRHGGQLGLVPAGSLGDGGEHVCVEGGAGHLAGTSLHLSLRVP